MAKLPSSLEIAQSATLRPIGELAEEAGLLPDEIDVAEADEHGTPLT